MIDRHGYLGSKGGAGVYQTIIAQMPPHDTYIETHVGTGAVLRRKPPARRSIAIDLDAVMLERLELDLVERVHADCIAFLNMFEWHRAGRVLVYADPPYLMDTRTSRQRYAHDYTDADHVALLSTLRQVPAAVMISGYPSALYDELLGDWRSLEFQAMTRGGVRTEKLWMNFPPGAVHWATFAGRDFVDRQRIKRKAARWAAKFKALPPAERTAILAALLGDG